MSVDPVLKGSAFNKFEAFVRPERLDSVKNALAYAWLVGINSARTGDIGDGKSFITPVADAIRVRTGKQRDQAH